MSAYYRYNITFGFEMERAYRLFNKAFGCNLKDNSDDYIGDGFKLGLDGDIVFVYFKSIENREFVISIIDKVADTLCADRYYELYDEKMHTDVNLYDEESLPKADKSLPKAELNYDDESLYVNASEAAAIAKAKPTVNTATLGNGFTFTYDGKVIEEIEANEYVEVYSNVVVVKSNNPKFKAGTKIEQISVSVAVHFEYADGREY
jgi:hypothetical protein